MAPHDFVEIRLVCKADYLDPQLKVKLHEIKDRLRELLHTGRRRFALKKVQPWNSVKVTFDIPKEAADRLHLLAVQGNVRLIELGILSVEIVGHSNAVIVNSSNNNQNVSTTNSKESSASSSSTTKPPPADPVESTAPPPSTTTTANSHSYDAKVEDHRHKRIKLENGNDQQNYPFKSPTTVNLMQPSSTIAHVPPTGHYMSQPTQQIIHRQAPSTPTNNYGRISFPNSISPAHPTYLNSGKPPPPQNLYQTSPTIDNNNTTLTNGIGNDMHNYHHHDSWPTYADHSNNYKMKVNGVMPNHYYAQQQQQQLILSDTPSSSTSNIYCTPQAVQYDMRRCEANISQMTTSTTNIQNSYDGSSTGLSS